MQDVVQFVGLLFLQHAVAIQMQPLLVQYLGHDLALYRLMVAFGIDTEHQLLLQLHQFATAILVLHHLLHQFHLFRVEAQTDGRIHRQGPADKGSLTHMLINSLLIDMRQHPELRHIKHIHRSQHHTAHNQLLIDGIDRWRQHDILHRLGKAIVPDARSQNIIEQLNHLPMVTGIEFFGWSVLQSCQRHIRDKSLQTLSDHLRRPVAWRGVNLGIERIQIGRMADVITAGDGGIEHIHPSQQIVVEVRHLGILIAAPPVVGHQLIVGLDGVEPIGVHLMRMHGQEIVRCRDGLAEVPIQQGHDDHIECFVLYHFFKNALARSISCCRGAVACWYFSVSGNWRRA